MYSSLSPVRERGGFPGLLCDVTKNGPVKWESSSNTVTRETTPFNLPTHTTVRCIHRMQFREFIRSNKT